MMAGLLSSSASPLLTRKRVTDVKMTCEHDVVLLKMMEGVLVLRDETFALLRMAEAFSARGIKHLAINKKMFGDKLRASVENRAVNKGIEIPVAGVQGEDDADKLLSQVFSVEHLLVATAQVQGASDVYSDFLEPNVLALRELHEQMETEFSVKIKPSRDLHEQAWRLLQPPVKEYSDLERYYAAPGADRPLEVQRKMEVVNLNIERLTAQLDVTTMRLKDRVHQYLAIFAPKVFAAATDLSQQEVKMHMSMADVLNEIRFRTALQGYPSSKQAVMDREGKVPTMLHVPQEAEAGVLIEHQQQQQQQLLGGGGAVVTTTTTTTQQQEPQRVPLPAVPQTPASVSSPPVTMIPPAVLVQQPAVITAVHDDRGPINVVAATPPPPPEPAQPGVAGGGHGEIGSGGVPSTSPAAAYKGEIGPVAGERTAFASDAIVDAHVQQQQQQQEQQQQEQPMGGGAVYGSGAPSGGVPSTSPGAAYPGEIGGVAGEKSSFAPVYVQEEALMKEKPGMMTSSDRMGVGAGA